MKTFKELFIEQERKIAPENPLYGTKNDPRLDITREYKTSESDPEMMRVMTAGKDLSYLGLRGYKGKPKYSKEELASRRAEAIKRARAKEKEKRRQEKYESYAELRSRPKQYIDAATGELRVHWPPHEPWIHPWRPEQVIHNYIPLSDDETILKPNPPRYKYMSVYSAKTGRSR